MSFFLLKQIETFKRHNSQALSLNSGRIASCHNVWYLALLVTLSRKTWTLRNGATSADVTATLLGIAAVVCDARFVLPHTTTESAHLAVTLNVLMVTMIMQLPIPVIFAVKLQEQLGSTRSCTGECLSGGSLHQIQMSWDQQEYSLPLVEYLTKYLK